MKTAAILFALLVSQVRAFVRTSGGASRVSALQAANVDDATRSPNPVITALASGMGLLKPVFQAEAAIQAAAFKAFTGVDEAAAEAEIQADIKANKVLIYTYGLSPFSSEAVKILKASGYPFTQKELGAEWFLLGGKESIQRVTLAEFTNNGATSLPKIFIGGNCIGGCSELSKLSASGELDTLMKQARVTKPRVKKSFFGR